MPTNQRHDGLNISATSAILGPASALIVLSPFTIIALEGSNLKVT
jgi:hypothetical protein